jgi:flagellar biosynthesis protein FliP
MNAAGYAGIVGTLAFVIGVILLVARAVRKFMPGSKRVELADAFSVVQRIPLSQRQGIAIIQRGDMLVAVSVGDGGVRPLFMAPRDVPTISVSRQHGSAVQLIETTPTMTLLAPPTGDVHADAVPAVATVADTSPVEVTLVPAKRAEEGLMERSLERSPDRAAERTTSRVTFPKYAAAAAVPLPMDAPNGVSSGDAFRKALRVAMRTSTVLSALFTLALALPSALRAQTPPPAPQQVSAPTAKPAAVLQPVTRAPARAGSASTLPTSGLPALRTLPAAGSQPGPRDLPLRADAQVQAPRPASPAKTASRSGGPAAFTPLLPAPQARDIAALKQRANGTPPLTTAESDRMVRRADSMLTRIAPQMDLKLGGEKQGEGLRLSGTVGVVIMMGLLSLLPVLLLMMTGFTRILIVLHFLKQALGTQTTPPGQLIAAMALLLSGFVMAPTLKEVNTVALEPWMDGKIEQVEMMSQAVVPFKSFMLKQVRDQDLQTFVDLADAPEPKTRDDVPLVILMSAFVTSELRTAFQIGFALFLPFIVIDVVVGSVLMSMGMVMLPPAMISLPFKLLLFVLVDGWGLVITGLVQSFR